MTVVATIDSVTTEDAHPTAAPHKISNIGGWRQAEVKFTPNDDQGNLCCSEDLDCSATLECGAAANGRCIRVVRLMFNGSGRKSGVRLMHMGMMCGIDVCNDADPANVPLRVAQGTQITHDIQYADTGGPADGGYDVTAYAFCSNSHAWSG